MTPSPKRDPDAFMQQKRDPEAFMKLRATSKPEGKGGVMDATLKPPETLLHRTGREIIGNLPGAFATGGALVMAPAGPEASIAGAGLMAGAGEYTRQLMLKWFPSMGTAPQNLKMANLEALKQILLGGATESGGQLLNSYFKLAAPHVQASAEKSIIGAMEPTTVKAQSAAREAAPGIFKLPTKRSLAEYNDTLGFSRQKTLLGRAIKATGTPEQAKLAGEFGLPGQLGTKIETAEKKAASRTLDAEPLLASLKKFEDAQNMPLVPDENGEIAPQIRMHRQAVVDKIKEMRSFIETALIKEPPRSPASRTIRRDTLLTMKRDMDKFVRDNGGRVQMIADPKTLPAELELNEHMADAARKLLNEDKPDIAEMNRLYFTFSRIKEAMLPAAAAEQIPKKSSVWTDLWRARYGLWLTSVLGAGAHGMSSGGYGAASRNMATDAGAIGLLIAIGEVAKTSIWKTTSAEVKNKLAQYLANGSFEEGAKLCARLLTMRNATLPASKTSKPPSP
jgi:hypothetical protein